MRCLIYGMIVAILAGSLASDLPPSPAVAEGKEMLESPFRQRQRVPPFPEGLTWLNTAGPLQLNDLRGKFVLIDFWTYCCINCMHILPELKRLEKAHPRELVVIGVHSAKFSTEEDTRNIAQAIQRYQIEHPVVNDAQRQIWQRFGVHAWPTVLLIDPEGYAVWGVSGEITFEQVEPILQRAIPYYRQKKLLDETPLRFDLESAKSRPTPLRFPGKVLADEPSGRLFIADSNHHRIVVTKLDGTLVDTIGAGTAGRIDGAFDVAQFNQPQGMAYREGVLYVADTENHLIRRADLARRQVTTIAGTGRQGRAMARLGKLGDPLEVALSSPWDLCLNGEDLFVAMAGCHQIWRMRLARNTIGPYAGNGREDIVDGPLLPQRPYELGFASFAQPSGLSSDGTWIYVADSEGSSIRAVPLEPTARVRTVVGTARLGEARLFTFGDADGPAAKARFQHPLGVAFYRRQLYVADTYNSKIREVDPVTGDTETLLEAGKSEDTSAFDEPAGLTAAAGKLFVADTNHHVIRTIDLESRRESVLEIPSLKPPEAPRTMSAAETIGSGGPSQKVALASVRPKNGTIRLAVELRLPVGYKINPLAPMTYRVTTDDNGSSGPVRRDALGKPQRLEKPALRFEITLPVDPAGGRDTVRVGLDYYYCREGAEGLCKTGAVTWTVPLQIAPKAPDAPVSLQYQVP